MEKAGRELLERCDDEGFEVPGNDQLFEERKSPEASNTYFQAFCVRFSNFGRLFTIGGVYPELLVEFPVDEVRSLVEQHGWSFVPWEALDEPYDGANRQLREQGITLVGTVTSIACEWPHGG